MKARTPANAFLDGYLLLAAGLTTNSKLDLIAGLSASLKTNTARPGRKPSFAQAFGAFESAATAENSTCI